MNVITFIIIVLKLLSMQGKVIVLAFVMIFVLASPVSGSTTKIAHGAWIFIGETNLDISKSLSGCHTLAWWQDGANTSAPPEKNITLYEKNYPSDIIYHFNVSPGLFSGHTGTWYCNDNTPPKAVFEVHEPELDIRIWDVDNNMDVSGKSVPLSMNITYRVDTNLYQALKPSYRPDINPSDSFFTVTMTDSYGQNISNIFTGNAGNQKTQILSFDKKPFITQSPYYWKNGKYWDRRARNVNGEPLYPSATYTFTITQNLNNMEESYKAGGTGYGTGRIFQAKTVTFVTDNLPLTPSITTQPERTTQPVISTTVSGGTDSPTTRATQLPAATRTTYSPLPEWITLLGIMITGLFVIARNR